MFTDTISDLLNRLRNASHARRSVVTYRSTKLVRSILDVMKNRGFISEVEQITEEGKSPELKITLSAARGPLEVKRISKPGQRIYIKHDEIRKVRNGFGISIISTSSGIVSGDEARKKKMGGEYLCEIY